MITANISFWKCPCFCPVDAGLIAVWHQDEVNLVVCQIIWGMPCCFPEFLVTVLAMVMCWVWANAKSLSPRSFVSPRPSLPTVPAQCWVTFELPFFRINGWERSPFKITRKINDWSLRRQHYWQIKDCKLKQISQKYYKPQNVSLHSPLYALQFIHEVRVFHLKETSKGIYLTILLPTPAAVLLWDKCSIHTLNPIRMTVFFIWILGQFQLVLLR